MDKLAKARLTCQTSPKIPLQNTSRSRGRLNCSSYNCANIQDVPFFTPKGNAADATRRCRLITAIKTPYLEDGRIDLKSYDKLVEKQIEAGVEGIIVSGTTGEGHLQAWDEHVMLIAHSARYYSKDLHIIGNTGSNSTREALHGTQQGFAVGMHAALQINPYYGKTSRTGLITHFDRVLEEGPAIVYNVPGRTGQDIPDDVMLYLAQNPNFAGVKECTGNDRIKAYADKGLTCWSGNDDEAHSARHSFGARGVISVTSNVIPKLYRRLMDEEDEELNKKCAKLVNWLFIEPNPIGLNTMLMMGGACQPVFRLPYMAMSREEREECVQIIEELGIEHTIFDSMKAMDDADFLYV
eukprot:CAMPEP_0196580648 /NCGR_PEP_ID=MMETSP1081-20130531/29804_1 /TAXON_ID=36882 /ORGANISM="Pyramimonas amylifera, Strain CCMP720" /LENGTH=352 /DNA_ID=CAMNT_0041900571 /DNA_START=81 /DNA_END=1139 /DNA_ORIENTATION=-